MFETMRDEFDEPTDPDDPVRLAYQEFLKPYLRLLPESREREDKKIKRPKHVAPGGRKGDRNARNK